MTHDANDPFDDTSPVPTDEDALVGFEWTCPICGQSRLNRLADGDGLESAMSAIKTHIVSSSGDGHGERNTTPEKLDDLDLEHHVVRIKGEVADD